MSSNKDNNHSLSWKSSTAARAIMCPALTTASVLPWLSNLQTTGQPGSNHWIPFATPTTALSRVSTFSTGNTMTNCRSWGQISRTHPGQALLTKPGIETGSFKRIFQCRVASSSHVALLIGPVNGGAANDGDMRSVGADSSAGGLITPIGS